MRHLYTFLAALSVIATATFPARAADDAAVVDSAASILDGSGLTGGFAVQIGCPNGQPLVLPEPFVVQTLDRDAANVAAARERLRKQGVYGRISAIPWDQPRLPYADNLVNLVVVSDVGCEVSEEEIQRILCPGGIAISLQPPVSSLQPFKKPWPDDIDQWTHYLHGPDNNAVASDRVVNAPERLQWLADPRHLRSHEHLNSLSALVSANGRIFTIIDEGPVAAVIAKPQWRIVARDAFNGLLLWKHDIGPWEGHFRVFRSGPPELARRLVAVGDRVYASLGYNQPVAALDAATGQLLQTYQATTGGLEIVVDQGNLYVVTGAIDETEYAETASRYLASPPPRHKGIVAIKAETGETLWQVQNAETGELMPTTLSLAGGRLFFQNTRQMVCLDAATGEALWRSDRPVYTTRLSWSAPTVVATEDVVLSSDGPTGGLPADVRRGEANVTWINSDQDIRVHPPGDLVAFDARSGERLWTAESLEGFCAPSDVFVLGDQVWAGGRVAPKLFGLDVGRNLKTGQVTWEAKAGLPPVGGHARCYRNKATERFFVLGGIGVEFLDLADGTWTDDRWLRGTCQYGVMPCNGLLYVPPDSCACRPNVRLHGFAAMAGGGAERDGGVKGGSVEALKSERLVRGPASSEISNLKFPLSDVSSWPTYRNDAARSGFTPCGVDGDLEVSWQTKNGGRLTPPTLAGNRVYVAQVDAHTVHALDAATGGISWSFTADGPVDSPPTIADGCAVFGCCDGWVYCLRASDGELVWKFRAAPETRMIMSPGGVESAWPVHGSVLVRDGLVWFAAGRSSYLDGGIRLFALRLATGEVAVEKRLDGRDAESWPQFASQRNLRDELPGTRPDILSASDDLLFMGWTTFDSHGELSERLESHLFSATGFLDDTWWHRTYWQYGTWMRGGFGGWPQAARSVPAGRLLVFNEDAMFGFGRSEYDAGNPEAVHAGHIGVIKDTYQDSGHVDHSQNPFRLFSVPRPKATPAAQRREQAADGGWETRVPILVRGMVLADKTLFIAGPDQGQDNETLGQLESVLPAQLWSVASDDGRLLQQHTLSASPVLDGLIASGGRLFVSCTDGSLCCLAGDAPVAKANEPVRIIFETDMAGDCDDVGALAALHALVDLGEAELLMVGVNREELNRTSAAAVDVINTFYGRPDIPIGTYKGGKTELLKSSPYAPTLRDEFPHDIPADDRAPDALPLYRQTLAGQPDGSVTIASVGGLSNLAELLESKPDQHSPLTGAELVRHKVRLLVAMAGRFPESVKPETNMRIHPAASKLVAEQWPTPIVWSGWEVGQTIITGKPLGPLPATNPVRRAYEKHFAGDRCSLVHGRASYDQTAVLYAVRGRQHLWSLVPGRIKITDEVANNNWHTDPNGPHAYLVKAVDDEVLAREINALMTRQPEAGGR